MYRQHYVILKTNICLSENLIKFSCHIYVLIIHQKKEKEHEKQQQQQKEKENDALYMYERETK